MIDLSLEFMGIRFQNPIFLAAGPPTMDAAHIIKAYSKGWGGAITKTIHIENEPKPLKPRIFSLKENGKIVLLGNLELNSEIGVKRWEKELAKLRNAGVPIITSLTARTSENWQAIGAWAEENGADIIEVSFSCPHRIPEEGICRDTSNVKLCEEATRMVSDSVSIPVITKLPGSPSGMAELALAAERGGASGVSAIDTVKGILGVDILSARAIPSVQRYSTFCGMSGPLIRPIGLASIAEIARTIDLPISGIGGIANWQNIIEYSMLGASTFQVATAVMLNGYSIIKGWLKQIARFIKKSGYESFADITGLALENVSDTETLFSQRPPLSSPTIDVNACNYCQKCITVCGDNATGAIKKDLRITDICSGCGLCIQICPCNAISFPLPEKE